jgi:hypothetical protein
MANELPDRFLPTGAGPIEEELERGGRYRELAEKLEAQLTSEPPLAGPQADAVRLRLVTIYEHKLHDQGRALAHVDTLLSGDVVDDAALGVASQFLDHRSAAPRVAALLSDAYARLGRTNDEIGTLTRELRLARLPRLADSAVWRSCDRTC